MPAVAAARISHEGKRRQNTRAVQTFSFPSFSANTSPISSLFHEAFISRGVIYFWKGIFYTYTIKYLSKLAAKYSAPEYSSVSSAYEIHTRRTGPFCIASSNMSRETTKITFEGLPLEVRQAILSAIPDLETLQAAIQTGHCLYSAFMDARRHITKNVLEHHIDPEFMYDAVMTEMTLRKKDPFTDEGLLAFVEKYKARDQELFHSAFQGTISQAFRLAQFHNVVEFFITDFASSALQHKEAETGAPQNRSLSWRERHRIGRSFYRFEVFCNIFTDNELYSHPNGTKVREKIIPDDYEYYNYFVPWENEQLACIRDYLFKTITPGLSPCDLTGHRLINIVLTN